MEFFLTLTIFSFVGISAAQHNMAYLGSINGKSYYADKTALNWTAANYLCRKYGLELATLNVKAEADFLKNAYIQHNIQDWHWVGAVDDYTKTFKWANTAARVETYSSLKMYPRGSESVGEKCLTYRYLETPGYNRESQAAYLYPEECHHVQRTLCQSSQQNNGQVFNSFGSQNRPLSFPQQNPI